MGNMLIGSCMSVITDVKLPAVRHHEIQEHRCYKYIVISAFKRDIRSASSVPNEYRVYLQKRN